MVVINDPNNSTASEFVLTATDGTGITINSNVLHISAASASSDAFDITFTDPEYNMNMYETPAGRFLVPGSTKVEFNSKIKRIKKILKEVHELEIPTKELPDSTVPYGRHKGRHISHIGLRAMDYYIEHCRTSFSNDCLYYKKHQMFFKLMKHLRSEFANLCEDKYQDMINHIPEFKGRVKEIEKRFRYFYSDYCSKTEYDNFYITECYNMLCAWFDVPTIRTRQRNVDLDFFTEL